MTRTTRKRPRARLPAPVESAIGIAGPAGSKGERSVLQVLPHPGGGGETYVRALSRIEGYRSERMYLAQQARPSNAVAVLLRGVLAVRRRARSHSLLHVHGEVAGALCLPSLVTRPSVVTLHGLHLLRRLDGLRKAVAETNLRLIVRAASRTICVSRDEYADVLEVVGERSARRVSTIRNGVEPAAPPSPSERAAERTELGIDSGTTVGVFVGALDETKDPITPALAALQVARTAGGLTLLMAGEGPMRPQLEQVASQHGGTAVRVLGHRDDVRRVLVAADFFVLSSRREGLSFALLEAMALGLPAVVSDAPGNPEAVGDAGIVVPFGDIAGFADAFARLRGNEHERRLLAERSRERVNREFRADQMLLRTREVYDEVLRKRDRR
jgi:glycosyltransferase involved in cell wall biosynthesis